MVSNLGEGSRVPEQIVKAAMQARVMSFHAETSRAVRDWDPVCCLEAVNMEISISASATGIIEAITAAPEQDV